MQFAWIVSDSLSASADAFVALAGVANTGESQATAQGPSLSELYEEGFAEGARLPLCDSCAVDLELRLTAEFFRFADRRYGGYLSRDLRELNWFIPRGKKDFSRLLDSLAVGTMDLSAYEPIHPQYQLLKAGIQRNREMARGAVAGPGAAPGAPQAGSRRHRRGAERHPPPPVPARVILRRTAQGPDTTARWCWPCSDSRPATACTPTASSARPPCGP
jgi:hypothetical protein